ncbi:MULTISPECIES: hypothetical protein [Nocardioides]|uniref:YcxB family protein n=1 Tax=Nocardioides vastitatis TaxID=2568655 RepID=A0ABW0ZL18_9ACTN|nr:hypothetical protein [Nocardioides sp.]THI96164.1 hypothetical protein E7Z54_17395 [Nocardioides sp.]
MTDTPMTERWVARRDSANQAAWAFLKLTLRRPAWWVYVAVVELLLALGLGYSFGDRSGMATRVVWGPVFAVVPTLGIAAVGLGVGYFLNRRMFGQRLREGAVFEAGIGERSLALRGPWADCELSFDGLAWVRSSGDWVFLKQKGSPVISVWSAALFLPADLGRLELSVGARKS